MLGKSSEDGRVWEWTRRLSRTRRGRSKTDERRGSKVAEDGNIFLTDGFSIEWVEKMVNRGNKN